MSAAGAARLRDHVDDGVGRAADRHRHGDGVLERRAGLDARRASGPPTPCRRCAGRPRAAMRGWLASAAGIDEAPGSVMPMRLGDRRHRGGRAHGHAVCRSCARCRPRSRASRASLMVPARRSSQYFQASEPEPSTLPCQLPRSIGPAGRKIAGQVRAGRAHQQRRRGLVAAAHQHRAVDRMAAQQLLDVHRQHVAVEHGGRLDEVLATATSPAARPESRPPAARRASRPRRAAGNARGRVDVGPGVDDARSPACRPSPPGVAHLHQCASDGRRSAGRPARTSGRFSRCRAISGCGACGRSVRGRAGPAHYPAGRSLPTWASGEAGSSATSR